MRFSSCVHLLNFCKCCLVDDQLAVVQNHIGAENSCDGGAYACDVACRLNNLLINVLGNDECLAGNADLVEEGLEGLGLDLFHLQAVNNENLVFGSFCGKSRVFK